VRGFIVHRNAPPLHHYMRIAGNSGPLFQKSCEAFRKCNTTAFFRSRPATLRRRRVAGSLIATSAALIPTGRRGKVMSWGQRVRGKREIEQEQLGLTNAQASDSHQRRHRYIARIILAPLGRQPLKGLLEETSGLVTPANVIMNQGEQQAVQSRGVGPRGSLSKDGGGRCPVTER
jgi:hypothetical protein